MIPLTQGGHWSFSRQKWKDIKVMSRRRFESVLREHSVESFWRLRWSHGSAREAGGVSTDPAQCAPEEGPPAEPHRLGSELRITAMQAIYSAQRALHFLGWGKKLVKPAIAAIVLSTCTLDR